MIQQDLSLGADKSKITQVKLLFHASATQNSTERCKDMCTTMWYLSFGSWQSENYQNTAEKYEIKQLYSTWTFP
jgi:hypothetical protein